MKKKMALAGIIAAIMLVMCSVFNGGMNVQAATGVGVPKNVRLYNPMIDTIYLKWNSVSGAAGYYVYYSTSENGQYRIARSLKSTSVIIKGMTPGQRYYFKVKAYDNIGTISEDSVVVSGKDNIRGIDVSKHNGNIDWGAVKSQIDFAILRVGYGDDIPSQDDTMWYTNANACKSLNIPFGVYIYSYANNTAQAASEATHVLRLIKGYNLAYPVFYDMEDASTLGTSASLKGDMAQTFCNTINSAGHKVGIYANLNWFNNLLTDGRFANWDKWVAQYNTQCDYKGKYMMWQYTSSGSVNGIGGNVDMNYMFTGTDLNLSNRSSVNLSTGGTVLSHPAGISSRIVNKNSVKITWSKVNNATRYMVYRKRAGDAQFVKVAVSAARTFTDKGLIPGSTYYYKVCSYTGIDGVEYFSTFSKEKTVKLYIPKPTDVTSVQVADKAVKLSWNNVSTADSYTIYKSTGNSKKFVRIISTKQNVFYDNQIKKGVKYRYRICSVKKVLKGNISSELTNPKGAIYGARDVTGIDARITGTSNVKLLWNKATGATNYYIYVSSSKNSGYKLIHTASSYKSSYIVSGLKHGETYYFKIRSVRNENGVTVKSSGATAITSMKILD